MKEALVLKRGTAIFVEWEDSASYAGWHPNTHGMKVGKVRSIGYVFGVNPDGVILSTSLARMPANDETVALDTVCIPHGCIKRLEVLELEATKTPQPLQLEGVIAAEAALDG